MVSTDRQKDYELISDAKLRLYAKGDWIFMATLCSTLQTVLDDTVAYGATDGKRLYINPHSFKTLTKDEQVFLLAHETLHVAYLHMLRMKPNKLKWNYATDYVINQFLVNSGFTLIQGALLDVRYRNLCAEAIYNLLPDELENNSLGDDLMSCNDDEVHEIQSNILVSAQIAKDKNQWDNLPRDIQRQITNLTKPIYNWKAILRKSLYEVKKYQTNWFKPNRRYLAHNLYLPTLDGEALSAMVCIDVSGSINFEVLNSFMSELNSLFKTIKVKDIEVVQFNTHITKTNKVTTLKELNDIKFIGYGGTNVKPAIDYFNDSKYKLCVVLTDGEFSHNYSTNKPIIWLVYGRDFNPKTGKVIYYETN